MKQFIKDNRAFLIVAFTITILSLFKVGAAHAAPIKQLTLACTSKSGLETFILKVSNGVATASNVGGQSRWANASEGMYAIDFQEGLLEINRHTGRYQWVMVSPSSIYNNVGQCAANSKPRI